MDKRTGKAQQQSGGAIRKDQRLSSRNFPQVCNPLYATSQRTLQQEAGVDRVKSTGIVIEIDLRIAAQLTVKVRDKCAKLGFRHSVRIFFVPLMPNLGKPDTVFVRENCPTHVLVFASLHEALRGSRGVEHIGRNSLAGFLAANLFFVRAVRKVYQAHLAC
jgi:hypothetical protein